MKRYAFLRKIDIVLGVLCSFLCSTRKATNHDTNRNEYKRVLLVKFWGLGNLTIIWPLINKIKERCPNSYIYFLTFSSNKGFLERHVCIDKILYVPLTANIVLIWKQFFSLINFFRKIKLDLIINFETFNNASGLFCRLLKAKETIGLCNTYEKIFYTTCVQNDPKRHVSDIFSSLVNQLGMNVNFSYHQFEAAPEEKGKIDAILRQHTIHTFICVHPGTSQNYIGKRVAEEKYVQLADALIESYNVPVVFTGTKNEDRLISTIIRRTKNKNMILNLSSKLSIWEYIALLKKTSLFIANDTGPAHIAASLGINSVVFFGPTTPEKYKPLNKNSLVLYNGQHCSPCVGINYEIKKCKINYQCLEFSMPTVINAITATFKQL